MMRAAVGYSRGGVRGETRSRVGWGRVSYDGNRVLVVSASLFLRLVDQLNLATALRTGTGCHRPVGHSAVAARLRYDPGHHRRGGPQQFSRK